MSQFVFIGGYPRAGTCAIAAFLQLHEQAFIYLSTNGPHPNHRDYYKLLQNRHSQGDYWAAEYFFPDKSVPDPYGLGLVIEQKSREWTKEKVFDLEVVGVREDFANEDFKLAKDKNTIPDRDIKLIFPMRLNVERFFYSQLIHHEMQMAFHQSKVPAFMDKFSAQVCKRFTEIQRLRDTYPNDVLVVNVVDGESNGASYRKICEFLNLTPNDNQMKWINDVPFVNSYGQMIRDKLGSIENHQLYKEMKNGS